MRRVVDVGNISNSHGTEIAYGARPVISLAPGAVISSGDGSEESPFVISE
jgi:hypothetical protein